jgi:uncharacterized protein (DUF2235 family)
MARQLVVFLDGTNNRFGHDPTNVIRILRSLKKDPDQILAFYDQGVGTFGIRETLFEWQKIPSRVFGLAFGWGIEQTVEAGYRFLATNYRHSDEIYLFGFSRGAYAVRALAAMIHALGLVAPHQINLFGDAWSLLHVRVRSKDPAKDREPDFALHRRFKDTFGREVPIRFLGIFDTVSSVGWIYNPLVVPHSANNPSVQVVRHAVSIDERRCFFRQNLWSSTHPNLKEVWFAGVHSDIGGGYQPADSQLALVAFRWMMGEAMANGLQVDADRYHAELYAPGASKRDPLGTLHNSLKGGWYLAEWVPRIAWNATTRKRHLYIGAMPPLFKARPRLIEHPIQVHDSVKLRQAGGVSYQPTNLTTPISEVSDDPTALWDEHC